MTPLEKNVVVQNLLARQALFLKQLQVLHQVTHREIGRIALAVIPEFLACLKGSDIRHRQLLAAVTASLEDSADQILVLPGEATEQNRDATALFGRERSFDRPMEMCRLVESGNLTQARAFCFQALLDFRTIFYLDEVRRHEFLRSELEF